MNDNHFTEEGQYSWVLLMGVLHKEFFSLCQPWVLDTRLPLPCWVAALKRCHEFNLCLPPVRGVCTWVDNTASSQPPSPALFWLCDGPTCTPGKAVLCDWLEAQRPGKPNALLCCPYSESCPSGEARIAESPSKSCNWVSENKEGESCEAGP